MSQHSVNEAESHLSELIDRALSGEEVTIVRDGAPVVALRPVPERAIPGKTRPVITDASLDWLEAHLIEPADQSIDSGTLLSRMRDEDDQRLS